MKEINFDSILDKVNYINLIDIRDKYLYNIENQNTALKYGYLYITIYNYI